MYHIENYSIKKGVHYRHFHVKSTSELASNSYKGNLGLDSKWGLYNSLATGLVFYWTIRHLPWGKMELQGPIFDHNHSWDYFDGTWQNHICGLGFIMYENDFSYFSFKGNVGEGTNNLVKLLSLLVLLKFAYN